MNAFNSNFSDSNSRWLGDLALKYKIDTDIPCMFLTNTYYFVITTVHSYFPYVSCNIPVHNVMNSLKIATNGLRSSIYEYRPFVSNLYRTLSCSTRLAPSSKHP